MKLKCLCGYIIRDQKTDLAYKALCLADQDSESYFATLENRIVDLIKAKFQEKTNSNLCEFPNEEDKSDTIDHIKTIIYSFTRNAYECENCGRIWIQCDKNPKSNSYVSYYPEGVNRGVFRSQNEGL